ncbi:unnamed protein product [Mytilus edulis]|uniref:Uncharacterized protein n=1 Tax=Mytilus edulis TaxID=6550 RepID=A0A8S3UKJ3_MYTED|nr:unnamed protein product [Mytilus edulis]
MTSQREGNKGDKHDCKALTDINETIQEVKTSNAFREIEQTLHEVVNNLKILSTNRTDNLESIENKRRQIEVEIKQARTKVNHHLDQLQDGLIKELMAVQQQESIKIQNILTSLDSKKEITELKVFFDNIKQKASDLQAFLTMKEIEKASAANHLNISKFGDISVSSDPCQLFIHKRKDRQAQIMLAVPTRNISNLVLRLHKHIDPKLSDIQGCSLLPKGRMVFSCYEQEKIRVHKSNGSKDYEINDIGKAVDVVFIGGGCIAVTSGHSNKINKDGNIYAVENLTHNVVVISPGGQRYRQLLSRDDGLSYPQVLHYDISTNKLLVANAVNDAFVYDVK